MRAPIENFYEEILDNQTNEVFCCGHRFGTFQMCNTQIVRSINLKSIPSTNNDNVSVSLAKVENCINIYVKPVKVINSTTEIIVQDKNPSDARTAAVHCRNCESILGHLSPEKCIVFNENKLTELWLHQDDFCIREFR